jgi:hypothetical protein
MRNLLFRHLVKPRHAAAVVATVLLIASLVASCVYIDSISVLQTYDGKEVAYAHAGDIATFTVKGHIDCAANVSSTHFVVAILVPKSWKVAENAVVTYKCDLAEDHETIMKMSVIPESETPKNGGGRTWVECLNQTYGVGTNVLDDMEWVVFQTDDTWEISSGQKPNYTIWIRTKMGTQNLKCHLGFFVNHTDDGFSGGTDHKKYMFSSECFEVVGGTGDVIDFCNYHFNKVTPMAALQDDFLTFSYVGGVATNPLISSGGDIYFRAQAITTDGKTYTVDEKTAKTLMKRDAAQEGTYNITFWPGGFFNVPEGEQLAAIRYWFENKDGSIIVGSSDEENPSTAATGAAGMHDAFVYNFNCD